MEEMVVEKRKEAFPFCPILEHECLREACALYDLADSECSILGINNALKEIVRTRVIR
jgi:hypothetical protein